MFSFIYLGHRGTPYGRSETRMLLFNDFMFHIISFHMHFFAGLAPEAIMQDMLGFSMIGFVIVLAVGNMYSIIGYTANCFKLLAIKFYNRFKFKKNKNTIVDHVEEPENRVIDLT